MYSVANGEEACCHVTDNHPIEPVVTGIGLNPFKKTVTNVENITQNVHRMTESAAGTIEKASEKANVAMDTILDWAGPPKEKGHDAAYSVVKKDIRAIQQVRSHLQHHLEDHMQKFVDADDPAFDEGKKNLIFEHYKQAVSKEQLALQELKKVSSEIEKGIREFEKRKEMIHQKKMADKNDPGKQIQKGISNISDGFVKMLGGGGSSKNSKKTKSKSQPMSCARCNRALM
jgi:hypothetical protein